MFQFESRGMRDLLQQAPPKQFEDVVALVALFRPGPMELIPDYVRRKQGSERVDYLDPRLEPILSPTYGVMVYQEQVMQIAQEIGGYTLGAADLLRRAMGKKLPEEMAKHRQGFTSGAVERGLSSSKATQLFDLMEKFAGYGFNKSHAAAYALIAYQTAYFKAHHPAPFMAANLSLVMDDTDKVRHFRDNALAMGLDVLPPDVNASNYRFEPVDCEDHPLRTGRHQGHRTGGDRGDRRGARAGGPFRDLFDFCRRVDKRAVNRRAIEALIRAGAFDRSTPRRATLIASVGPAIDRRASAPSVRRHRSRCSAKTPARVPRAAGADLVREWSDGERLAHEKASLGFYLSGHPYNAVAAELSRLVQQRLGALQPTPTPVRIAGVVAAMRTQTSRRGKMAFVTLDDGKDQAEIAVFNETFDAYRHLLRDDALLVAEVKVLQRMGEEGQVPGLRIVAEAIYDLAGARRKWARALKLACNGGSSAERLLRSDRAVRARTCPVTINYRNASPAATSSSATPGASTSTIICSAACASGCSRRTWKSSTRRSPRGRRRARISLPLDARRHPRSLPVISGACRMSHGCSRLR